VTVRPLILLGVILGLLLGTVAAIAIPRTRADEPPTAATTPAAPIAPGPSTVLRTAPAWPAVGAIVLRPRSTPRIEARAVDPLGGPDWAVRTFLADRVTKPGLRRHGVDPTVGHVLCAQVGRIHDGTFGWLDARGTFRALRVGTAFAGTSSWCGSRAADLRHEPQFDAISPMTEPAAPAAAVKSTVAWGVAGAAARRITLRLGTRTVTPRATAHGVFLAVAGPELDQHQIGGSVVYPDRTVRLGGKGPGPAVFGGADPTAPAGSGRPQLAARAPDPNGGLPFGLVASHSDGQGWCLATGGRVVGDRVGTVDFERDTLSELRVAGGGSCTGGQAEAEVFRRMPVLLGSSGGGPEPAGEGGDAGGTGRVARRTQQGMTIFDGRAAPDVVSVTLETPRDVRTLIPGGPAHAILAVYDGPFPTGEVRVIARFRDGHTKVQTLGDQGF
jgi:hypothetical protein